MSSEQKPTARDSQQAKPMPTMTPEELVAQLKANRRGKYKVFYPPGVTKDKDGKCKGIKCLNCKRADLDCPGEWRDRAEIPKPYCTV